MPLYNHEYDNVNVGQLFYKNLSDKIPKYLEEFVPSICLVSKKKKKNTTLNEIYDKQKEMKEEFGNLASWIAEQPAQADWTESGTGCFIARNAVLTAYHVISIENLDKKALIEKAEEFSIFQKNKTISVSGVLYENAKEDLIVLEVSESISLPSHISFPRLGDADALRAGNELEMMGFPFSSVGIRYSKGKVISNDTGSVKMEAQIDGFIGNSGSPVFNKEGDIVGVYCFSKSDFRKGPTDGSPATLNVLLSQGSPYPHSADANVWHHERTGKDSIQKIINVAWTKKSTGSKKK